MKNQYIWSILWSVGVFLLWGGYICLWENERKLIEEANEVFLETVVLDKAQRGSGYLNNFSSREGTGAAGDSVQMISESEKTTLNIENKNELSYDEKKYIYDQLYLLYKNPIRANHLDSLFNEKLQAKGIHTETAVVYTAQGKSESSRSDSLFLAKATALPLMKIGDIIKLQGYVLVTNWMVWNQIPYIWVVSVLIVCLGIGGVIFIIRKRKREEKEQMNLVGYIQIRNDLYFKGVEGILLYKGQKIYLQKKSTELLAYLLQGDDCFRSYDELQSEVWKMKQLTRDAMRVAVKRLNGELDKIPGFSVETVPGKGFRVDINN